MQGGLELPDREYYVCDSPHMRDLRTKYQAHVATMFKLAGFDNSDSRAANVLALEHAIAEKHSRLQIMKTFTRPTTPGVLLTSPLRPLALTGPSTSAQPGSTSRPALSSGSQLPSPANPRLSPLHHSAPGKTGWPITSSKTMLEFCPRLSPTNASLSLARHSPGTPQQRPRWQRGVFVVNGLLGDEVGKLYAQRYFSPEAKAEAQAMVANIIAAFRKRIDALAWMAPATKAEAQAKLDTLYVGIGYPETWIDYSNYEVKSGRHLWQHLARQPRFTITANSRVSAAAVDRKEWSMTPQTVNAVNLPLQNALNFPAAILQPPFFDPRLPPRPTTVPLALSSDTRSATPLTPKAAAFDSKGRVRDWWTPGDLAHFEAAAAKLAPQYDTYLPFPDIHSTASRRWPKISPTGGYLCRV